MSHSHISFFWFLSALYIVFHSYAFSLFESLNLRHVSCRQHVYGSCFLMYSANLCLLIGEFHLLAFTVITDKAKFISAISLLVFYMSSVFFFLYSSVITFFCVTKYTFSGIAIWFPVVSVTVFLKLFISGCPRD